jgi:transcriptional regulator with XRE-family HTH domain
MQENNQSGTKPFRSQGRSSELSSEMMKAGRALLRWEQSDLARESDLSLAAIKRIERIRGVVHAQRRTIRAIVEAFERAGVDFERQIDIDGRSVRDVVTIDWRLKFYDELNDEERKALNLADYENEADREYIDSTAIFPIPKLDKASD